MIRILIVDDQKIVREGIKILLEKKKGIEIVGDACDGTEGLEKVKLLMPDLVLLDINMPGISGLTVADKIRSQFSQVKIIMLSSHEDLKYVQKATEYGAKGYLLKNASSQELEWAIKLVYQGYSAIKSELLEKQFLQLAKSELNSKQNQGLRTTPKPVATSTIVLSDREQSNSDELQLLLAKKQVSRKYSKFKKQQKQHNPLIHEVRLSQFQKTMKSFEFKLLVFIILFCLALLVFVTLSST
jgi:YesN/AraC family two-component response regulator